ncbi:hypothetical protein [Rubellicoccus peritrichatus]|uniref:PEP-CTERM protein-sorting domain-containing protein n=1 Tax=Rubellicoccus peritrichatus TaxID=3080537 RepID=A0AAQ3L8E2_9BACT|nr:hypothetical protein [Puniceicoccus sp. CR14]WOO39819.1 hypothetical protein RZN69_14435 [Puniceicoccus sp. CR14]
MITIRSKSSKATAATLTSLVAASSAQGIIQYFDTSNEFSAGLGSNGITPWDIDGNPDGLADARWNVVGSYMGLIGGSAYGYGGPFAALVTFDSLLNLPVNETITAYQPFEASGASALIVSGEFNNLADFTSGVSGYMGFRLPKEDMEGNIKLGWAEVTFYNDSNPSGIGVTVHRWAFQDDGSNIQVGAIPEPATIATGLGALAMGAAGLRRWRKAKKAK